MTIWMDVDAALAEVPVNAMPLVDDGDFKSIEASVAYNAAGLTLVWNFITPAGAQTQTAVTPTNTGNYLWTSQGNGVYAIQVPASGGGTINNNTEGFGWFSGVATGVLPWRGPMIGFRAAGLNDLLIENTFSTTRALAGTALPDAAAAASGGLFVRGTGAGAINQAANGQIDVNVTTAAGTAWGSGAITAGSIASSAIADTKIATGAITSAKFAAGAINAAAIAADAITDAKVASDVTIASVTGAVGSVTGAVGSVSGAVGSVIGAVGSVTGNVGGSVASIATGGITAASFAANAINAAKLDPDVTTELQAGLATAANLATVAGYLDTEIAAILADTNELQTDWVNGGRLDLILDARASQTSVDTVDTVADGIKAVTDALPNAGALTSLATAAALTTVDTVVDAIKVIADKVDDTLEDDAGTFRFTTNALEQAPTGGSAPSAAAIRAEIDSNSTQLAAIKAVTDKVDDTLEDDGGTQRFTANALEEAPSGTGASAASIRAEIDANSTQLAAILADTAALDTRVPSDPADASVVAGLIAAMEAKVDTVDTVVDGIAAKTVNLPNDPADQSLIIAATSAIVSTLGSPAGVSVSADIAAVKLQTAAIEVDTQDLQTQVGVDGAGLTAIGDTRLANLDAAVSTRLASGSYSAAPSAATVASQVRTELTTELARVDATVSSRATPAQVNTEADTALADVGLTTTITGRIDAAVSTRLATAGYTAPPSAATNASAVRMELGVELARVDAAVSSRSSHSAADVWANGTRTLTNGAGMKKNTAQAAFMFLMVDDTDGKTPETGLAITAQRSLDGAAFASCANSATEVSNGWYKIDLAAADDNGDVVVLRFSGTGARTREFVILTEP